MAQAPAFALGCLLLLGGDAWLGVMLDQGEERPTIAEVIPGSPAESAGLRPGDVLLAVGGEETPAVEDLVDALGRRSAGARVTIRFERAGESRSALVTLARRPGDAAPPSSLPARRARGRPAAPAPEPAFGAAPRLLVFTAPWSASCRALDRVLRAPALGDALAPFVVERIDPEAHPAEAGALGVVEIPHLVVLGVDGEPQGAIAGFHPPGALAAFLGRQQREFEHARALAALRAEVAALRRAVAELAELLQER